jgi:apolipoprotein N-acyltransferase
MFSWHNMRNYALGTFDVVPFLTEYEQSFDGLVKKISFQIFEFLKGMIWIGFSWPRIGSSDGA